MEEKPNKWQGALDPHVSYWRLFISRTWLGIFIAGIGAYWALVAGIVWMPRVLEEVLGYSHGTVGFLVAVPPAISVIAMMLVPWLSSRAIKAGASRRTMRGVLLGGGVVVCGILAFIAPRIQGGASVALMCIVFGAPSFVYPLMGLMIAHINPVKQRGVMLATLTAFITATGFFAPGLLGHAIQAGGGLKSGGFTDFFDLTAIVMIVTGLIGAVSIHPQFDARRFGLERS
jgi:MFS family permease